MAELSLSSRAPAPLRLAVVGHTNAGKTSLLRALTRKVGFGEVSNRPGTTRHVEAVDLRMQGRVVVRFLDTPGLEDSVALQDFLGTQAGESRLARVQQFLQGPEARGSFEQEAKVLRSLLEQADAGLLVIDTREPVLPKFRAEIEILGACARPLMPVLNFVADADSRVRDWEQLLRESGLHAQARFDVVAPFHGAEQALYTDLGVLLPAWKPYLAEVVQGLAVQAEERLQAAARIVAGTLIDVAAMRRTLQVGAADEARRQSAVHAFQDEVRAHAHHGLLELLKLFAFRMDDAELADLPALAGRWESDLFNPELLQQAGTRLGLGAMVGAGVGLVADLALAGLSLGAGTAVGASVGGALSGGLRPVLRKLQNKLTGLQELSVEDPVLLLLAERLSLLVSLLARRSHAAQQRLRLDGRAELPAAADQASPWLPVLRQLRPARAHPEWERGQPGWKQDTQRQQLEQGLAALLLKNHPPGDSDR